MFLMRHLSYQMADPKLIGSTFRGGLILKIQRWPDIFYLSPSESSVLIYNGPPNNHVKKISNLQVSFVFFTFVMRKALLLLFTASAVAASALPQEPGSPGYNCHAACGGAITAGRTAAGDQSVLCAAGGEFVSDYTAYIALANLTFFQWSSMLIIRCLDCVAQPDLSYIWGIYGNSISPNGAICSLPTSPETSVPNSPATATSPPETTIPPTTSPTATILSVATPTTPGRTVTMSTSRASPILVSDGFQSHHSSAEASMTAV